MIKDETRVITDPVMIGQIGRIYAECRSEVTDEYQYVDCSFFNEWRWGTVNLLTLRDRDGNLWGVLVREAAEGSGADWDQFDKATAVLLETVIPIPRTVYVIARLNKW